MGGHSKSSGKTVPPGLKPFAKGPDPRRNLKGRPPLSQQQREFRQRLHDMEADILGAVADLVKVREPSVTNKLIEKLAGRDEEVLNVKVEDKTVDLSKLSAEQLREWRRLQAIARGDAGAD